MSYDTSVISYFWQAGLIVKAVMLILIAASIFSWAYILQRTFFLQDVKSATKQFETNFQLGDLSKMYSAQQAQPAEGVQAIFNAGYKEFLHFRHQTHASVNQVVENVKRAMRVAQMREQDKMENHLSFLAIVGSTSPYVGLFGTVWGIMQAFRALANVQQASIALVAPGIAEALIATALGLFAAIPAVIAYNRFVTDIGRLMNRYDAFQEEFTNVLIRQAQPAADKDYNVE